MYPPCTGSGPRAEAVHSEAVHSEAVPSEAVPSEAVQEASFEEALRGELESMRDAYERKLCVAVRVTACK